MPKVRTGAILAAALVLAATGEARERAYLAALESIKTEELLAHVEVLADDAYEGRSSGTRGGRAAAAYLAQRLEALGMQGGADDGGFFQPFAGGKRNVLAKLPGSDPELAGEWIVVSAHYDHVGYGNRRTSFGPIGYIHNGADDNASGVAALLEFCEAVATNKLRFRRPVLIAFWDGEEIGMLGSQHWARRPTVPFSQVKLAVNIDMIGRLRDNRLEVIGSRTGYGLRQLASVAVDPGLWIDFNWLIEPNSDHWTFISRRVPTLMLHTGLHDDYHRPSDDVDLLNMQGIRTVSRYLFDLVAEAGDAESLPGYRPRGRGENPTTQKRAEQPLPPLPAGAAPPRVGISWRADEAEPGAVFLTRVTEDSPAQQAGLRLHDRVLALDGDPFANSAEFEKRLLARLADNADELLLLVERRGRIESAVVHPLKAD